MKKIGSLVAIVLLFSCNAKKSMVDEEFHLYEVLKEDQYNGARIKFYEIISEPQEFNLLLQDPDLKKKVQSKDILTANFVVFNLGEKTTGGYSVIIKNIEETEDSVLVTIEEVAPKGMATMAISYPMMVIKINSKKPIIFN